MCEFCVYVPDQNINLKNLIKYTYLPELWDVFNTVLSISSASENGMTLDNAMVYLKDFDISRLQLTHSRFWLIMKYFLDRTNKKFLSKLKMQRKKA
jgi:hypothetical protein